MKFATWRGASLSSSSMRISPKLRTWSTATGPAGCARHAPSASNITNARRAIAMVANASTRRDTVGRDAPNAVETLALLGRLLVFRATRARREPGPGVGRARHGGDFGRARGGRGPGDPRARRERGGCGDRDRVRGGGRTPVQL